MSNVLIIFASTGGNTEMTVELVAEHLKTAGHNVTLQWAQHSKPEDLLSSDVCVLAAPTYGIGVLQEYMEAFVNSLGDLRLEGKRYAVIGLGDPKYELQYHIESANLLEKEVKDRGGELFPTSLRISKSPVWFAEKMIPFWSQQLSEWI